MKNNWIGSREPGSGNETVLSKGAGMTKNNCNGLYPRTEELPEVKPRGCRRRACALSIPTRPRALQHSGVEARPSVSLQDQPLTALSPHTLHEPHWRASGLDACSQRLSKVIFLDIHHLPALKELGFSWYQQKGRWESYSRQILLRYSEQSKPATLKTQRADKNSLQYGERASASLAFRQVFIS